MDLQAWPSSRRRHNHWPFCFPPIHPTGVWTRTRQTRVDPSRWEKSAYCRRRGSRRQAWGIMCCRSWILLIPMYVLRRPSSSQLPLIVVGTLKSIRLAVAYYAYALRRPDECLSTLAQVKALTEIQNPIPQSGSTRSNTMSLQVPDSVSSGSISSLSGTLASVITSGSVAEVGDGSSWTVIESIRSICLQGERPVDASPFIFDLRCSRYVP